MCRIDLTKASNRFKNPQAEILRSERVLLSMIFKVNFI